MMLRTSIMARSSMIQALMRILRVLTNEVTTCR